MCSSGYLVIVASFPEFSTRSLPWPLICLMLALVDLLLPFQSRFYYNSTWILFLWLDRYVLWTVAKWNDQFCDRNSHNYIYLSFILFPMETRSLRPYRIFLALPWHSTAFIKHLLPYIQVARTRSGVLGSSLLQLHRLTISWPHILVASQSYISEKIDYFLLCPGVKGSVVRHCFSHLYYLFSMVPPHFCHNISFHFGFWQCTGVYFFAGDPAQKISLGFDGAMVADFNHRVPIVDTILCSSISYIFIIALNHGYYLFRVFSWPPSRSLWLFFHSLLLESLSINTHLQNRHHPFFLISSSPGLRANWLMLWVSCETWPRRMRSHSSSTIFKDRIHYS